MEVQVGLRAVRGLRASLIDLAARLAAEDPDRSAALLLVDPGVTNERLSQEWAMAERILRPELLQRLTMVVSRAGRLRGIPRDPDPQTLVRLERAMKTGPASAGLRLPRLDTYPEILKVLLARWLATEGPITADQLCRTVGCNYRTVARAVARLRPSLEERSDRRLALRRFPREEWSAILALGERARTTVRFVDVSGQPRSPHALLARLRGLGRADVGVGGLLGAAHHCPQIDPATIARLDLSIHCPEGLLDLGIVGRLDPALTRSHDPALPALLTLHVLRRRMPLFASDGGGLRWADPAECLLDLHEARLEPEARLLIEGLPARRRAES